MSEYFEMNVNDPSEYVVGDLFLKRGAAEFLPEKTIVLQVAGVDHTKRTIWLVEGELSKIKNAKDDYEFLPY